MINQAIILAAGRSSRFSPFAVDSHKSTFELMDKPIIVHTINSLIRANISNITVVHNPQDQKLMSIISSLKKDVQMIPQPKPLGQANAIVSAIDATSNTTLIINAQHINIDQHLSNLEKFLNTHNITPKHQIVFSQKTDHPSKYGILKLDGIKVTNIIEKPAPNTHISKMRVVGIYLLSKDFINFMKDRPISKYQLETDLVVFAQKNKVIAYPTTHKTVSLKYAWDLQPIATLLLKNITDARHPTANIHHTAIINSPVIISEHASVHEYAIIDGPSYIGPHAIVGRYCEVGQGSIIGSHVELQRRVEIKRTIIGQNTHVHSGSIIDSIVGDNVRIGANFITANKRLDRTNIKVRLASKNINSFTNSLGSFIGDNSNIGIHCGTNPGTIIPPNTFIKPNTIYG